MPNNSSHSTSNNSRLTSNISRLTSNVSRLTSKSEFTRNVLTLMTGTTIAQAIPIAISPILTRLYTPEDFGILALFVAITSIFGSIANGRYELAIMLPKKNEDAINIFALGFIINVVLSLFLLLIVLIFHDYIVKLLNNKEISPWLYFIPISVFLMGIFNLLNYFNNRMKQYKDLAKANVYKSIGMAVVQLSLGFLKTGVLGLISGQIFSQLISNTKLFFNVKKLNLFRYVKKGKIIVLAKRYKNFPLYSTFAVFANTASQHLTNILISFFYTSSTLGHYFLAQKTLGFPITLIGNSFSQVFFQEATKEKQKTGIIANSFNKTLKKLIIIAFPIFLILFFSIEDIFSFVFGKNWFIAGIYAKILIPLFFIRFIVSTFTLVPIMYNNTKLDLLFQIGLLGIYISILSLGNYLEFSFKEVLIGISTVLFIYYFSYLILIYITYIKFETSKGGY